MSSPALLILQRAALLLLLGVSLVALAGERLVVISLKHRMADELVEQIRPVIGAEGAVTGQGDKLLVRAGDEQLAAIRAMVAELDRPAVSLLITVVQGAHLNRARLQTEFGISARVGNLAATTGSGVPRVTDGVSASGSLSTRTTRQRDVDLQRVRATSGYPAWIGIGQSEPYRAGGYDEHGHHRETVVFRAADTGFSALPQVVGERVVLELSATRQRLSSATPGAIVGSAVVTTLSGVLGEWLEVGALNSTAVRQGSAGVWSTVRTERQGGGQIWLRVQRLE